MKPSWTSPWRGIYTSQELSAVFQVFPSHYLGFKRLLGIYFPLLQRSSYLTLKLLDTQQAAAQADTLSWPSSSPDASWHYFNLLTWSMQCPKPNQKLSPASSTREHSTFCLHDPWKTMLSSLTFSFWHLRPFLS